MRRSGKLLGRDRRTAALFENALIRAILRFKRRVALAKHTIEDTPETVQEYSSPDSSAEEARLIRVRACHSQNFLYSADDPTGAMASEISGTSIQFGGVYSGYDTNIMLSYSDDLVYFDEIPDFVKLFIATMLSPSAKTPSEMEWIAVSIDQLRLADYQPLVSTIDNAALAGVLLVVTADSIRDMVRDVDSDQWGFRKVPTEGLREHAPALYSKGMKLVESFNNILVGGEIEHMFVFDWDQHGK